MQVIRNAKEMQNWALARRGEGKTIGFVPTMGFLHKGHLDLMRVIRKDCDYLLASIFVNPMQFNDPKDLESYPHDEQGDLDGCEDAGCDLVFIPSVTDIYPENYLTKVEVDKITLGLCGKNRPGHFTGVSTVVTKLFNLVQPTISAFGQKDYQQLATICKVVEDLNMPIKIVGVPTVREDDGLAMSSRNARLTDEERAKSVWLYKALNIAKQAYENGEKDAKTLRELMVQTLKDQDITEIDYIDFVDAKLLQPVDSIDQPSVIAIAIPFSKSRLIDNIQLG